MSEHPTPPAGGAPAPPAGAPPQVIVVLTDQQRWDTAGVHGNRAGVTPEFDRIAREGTLFGQAVTPLRELFGDAMPSITTIGVQALYKPEIKVEIEMVVRLP